MSDWLKLDFDLKIFSIRLGFPQHADVGDQKRHQPNKKLGPSKAFFRYQTLSLTHEAVL